MLQKFEDRKLTDGKEKNQVVMDALENNNGTKEDKWVTKEFLEQRLEQFKQECKGEILRELFRILVGSRMAGRPFMVSSPIGKSETEKVMKDGVADISGTPDVMDKIMDWSDG